MTERTDPQLGREVHPRKRVEHGTAPALHGFVGHYLHVPRLARFVPSVWFSTDDPFVSSFDVPRALSHHAPACSAGLFLGSRARPAAPRTWWLPLCCLATRSMRSGRHLRLPEPRNPRRSAPSSTSIENHVESHHLDRPTTPPPASSLTALR